MDRQKSGEQPKALAITILAVAENIDNLEALTSIIKEIGEKHCNANIKAEHYPIVGQNLLRAIKDVLREDATADVLEAWVQAYEVIAKIFIDVEKNIYASKTI